MQGGVRAGGTRPGVLIELFMGLKDSTLSLKRQINGGTTYMALLMRHGRYFSIDGAGVF